jgi:hypothetical protein
MYQVYIQYFTFSFVLNSPVFRKLINYRCNGLISKYTFTNLGAAKAFLWYLSERTKIEVAATVSRLSRRQGVTIGL